MMRAASTSRTCQGLRLYSRDRRAEMPRAHVVQHSIISTMLHPPKRHLLIALDAFDTLFTPKQEIHKQYIRLAQQHGLAIPTSKQNEMKASFRDCKSVRQSQPDLDAEMFLGAFKRQSLKYPNYGKAVDMGAEKWWQEVRLIKSLDLPLWPYRRAHPVWLTPACFSDSFESLQPHQLRLLCCSQLIRTALTWWPSLVSTG